MTGKFMSPTQMEFRRFDPPRFAAFTEPGHGKAATSFPVLPYGTRRSLLCTETPHGYHRPGLGPAVPPLLDGHRPFAGYIMRHRLTLARQHAEQGQ